MQQTAAAPSSLLFWGIKQNKCSCVCNEIYMQNLKNPTSPLCPPCEICMHMHMGRGNIWHITASVLQRHFWFCWNIKMDDAQKLHMAGPKPPLRHQATQTKKNIIQHPTATFVKIHTFSADKYLLNRFIICCTIS